MKLQSLKNFSNQTLSSNEMSSIKGGKIIGYSKSGTHAISTTQSASGCFYYTSDTYFDNGQTGYTTGNGTPGSYTDVQAPASTLTTE